MLSTQAQSPSRTIAFVSIGAVKPLAEVQEFRGCKHKFGFAIRALHAVRALESVCRTIGCRALGMPSFAYHACVRMVGLCQWHAFGVKDKEEQQQWIALLRNEMVTASIASAIAMGGNELVGR